MGQAQASWEMVPNGPEAEPQLLGLVQVWGWPVQGQGPRVRVWADLLLDLQALVQESLQQRYSSACHVLVSYRALQRVALARHAWPCWTPRKARRQGCWL